VRKVLGARSLILVTAVVVLGGVTGFERVAASTVQAGWSIQPSPNPGGFGNSNSLGRVSCVSGVRLAGARRCVAAGSYYDGSHVRTLIEAWDGTNWSVTPSPNRGTFDNYLFGVSCVNASRCVAVGFANTTSDGPSASTLVEMWDGRHWSITPSPDVAAVNVLDAVSCVAANSCVAVGYSNNTLYGYSIQTLVERWDGKKWSVVDSPNPGYSDELAGVSCVSRTRCVAVGGYQTGNYQTLVETWNGTYWSVTPSPNLPGTINLLSGVSCTSAAACVAVGTHHENISQTLVEQWDGTNWSIVASPSPGTSYNAFNGLNGVSCVSATRCVAVGEYYDGAASLPTLVETWDGTNWSVTPSPSQVPLGNYLNGVSCVSASSCVAVGSYLNGSHDQTLVIAISR
jgi:hypothetical protein